MEVMHCVSKQEGEQKFNPQLPRVSAIWILGINQVKWKFISVQIFCANIHSICIHNSPKLELTQMFVNR